MTIKDLIPAKPRPVTVLRGPFRGARFIASPRNSLRQILGVYEHELNPWISQTLPRVNQVLDAGASAGYFTFGCAAAFRRLKRSAKIHAFEPEPAELNAGLSLQPPSEVSIQVYHRYVGAGDDSTLALDSLDLCRKNTLIKIDVEGAEVDVIGGATTWLNATNYFLIEVHWHEAFITSMRATFAEHGLSLTLVNQVPLPLIGRENRAVNSWWLLSNI